MKETIFEAVMTVVAAMTMDAQAARSNALHDRTSFSEYWVSAANPKGGKSRGSQESNAMLTMNYPNSAFTLIELIVVLAVIGILVGIGSLAFQGIQSSNQFSRNVYQLADEVKLARSYALANNTYVYLGLTEVDRTQNPGSTPQVAGIGRVDVGLVATTDGVRFDSTNYSGANLVQVRPVACLDMLHIASSLPAATSGGMTRPSANVTNLNSGSPLFATSFSLPLGLPLSAGQYNFTLSIPFNPQGAITINGNAVQYVEIDLLPCVGSLSPANPVSSSQGNQAALIVDGSTGAVTVCRP
jgi:prepilin-type N-terminal cleavage/methylation domain-containing protein